jgi:hypothetical protein
LLIEHVATPDQLWIQAIDDKLGVELLGVQEANDSVGIADGRYLWGGHDQGLVGPGDRITEALFDASRAIDEDVIVLLF